MVDCRRQTMQLLEPLLTNTGPSAADAYIVAIHMCVTASQNTDNWIVCSTDYSGWQQRNIKVPLYLLFVNVIHRGMMTSSNGNISRVTGHFWRGIHRWPVNSPHKGQGHRILMFSLICAWINGWVNNREAGDLRRHPAHCDVTVMRPDTQCQRGRKRFITVISTYLFLYFRRPVLPWDEQILDPEVLPEKSACTRSPVLRGTPDIAHHTDQKAVVNKFVFQLIRPSIFSHRNNIKMTSSNGNISALLALCVENSPVTGEFPAQRPVSRSFDVFFDLRQNKRLSKQSWSWWFETLSCSLWRHYNVNVDWRDLILISTFCR